MFVTPIVTVTLGIANRSGAARGERGGAGAVDSCFFRPRVAD